MERGAIDDLANIIMSGGSKAAVRPQPNAAQRVIDTGRGDLLRAIFGVSQEQAGEANARTHDPRRR